MKELIIFLFLFLAIFSIGLFIFNGRFIYDQVKYYFLGPAPVVAGNRILDGAGEKARNESSRIPERLMVPSLGIDVPIVLAESTDEVSLQNALEKGVVFWPESALLEEKGTIIILGHSSAYPWYKGEYGSVFSLLDRLKSNDEIFVFSAKNKYTYLVADKEINLPENLNIVKQDKQSILYLLSCWPIKTNWKRIAIKAVSIDTR